MTELDDKASRRAQRREQQQNDPNASQAPEGPEAEGEGGDESSGSGGAAQQIRDRNARIRAQAAEERRAKRERDRVAVAAPTGLDAAERMDDLFVRSTHAAAGWIRKNFKWLQWVVLLSVFGGFGYQAYRYVSRSKAAKSTDALFVGVTAEGGTLRPAADDEAANAGSELAKYDPRPVYASADVRAAAAMDGYRKVVAAHGDTGPGWIARLGLAGILYDQKKWDEALAQYRAVRGSELAKTDGDVLGRSLEGIGLCLEAKGDRQGALTAFRELTNQESAPWLATLGLFHQSRLLLAEGNKEKAKELATKAKERLDKEEKEREGKDPTGMPRSSYLSESVKMLLARIDPNAAPTSVPNIQELIQKDPDKIQKLLQDLQKKQPPTAPSAPGGAP